MTDHYKMIRQILNGDYRAKYPDYDQCNQRLLAIDRSGA
jgi:hypothetical protein